MSRWQGKGGLSARACIRDTVLDWDSQFYVWRRDVHSYGALSMAYLSPR